jgi:hypothetical protein
MKSLTERYLEFYTPLVQEFIQKVESLPIPEIKDMPEPFLPLFGKDYEQSALRIIFIGQDTRWWWDLRKFTDAEKTCPGSKLRERLDQFRTRPFTEWGKTRNTFWGFVMMTIAALHGKKDWGLMKAGAMVEILNSIACGNANAIELFTSSAKRIGVPEGFWNAVRVNGEPFDRFQHIVETLKPRVAIILCKGLNTARYFGPHRVELVSQKDGITHYRLPEIGVDVFQVPHPVNMKFNQGADHFCTKLTELLINNRLILRFPQFLARQADAQHVMDYLYQNAPPESACDKFDFVAWVATELTKRDTFMSVPALCELLNSKGYKTNYGASYDAGRGSYRLVRSAYYRLVRKGEPETAKNIALAFRRPNFMYAYSTDSGQTSSS